MWGKSGVLKVIIGCRCDLWNEVVELCNYSFSGTLDSPKLCPEHQNNAQVQVNMMSIKLSFQVQNCILIVFLPYVFLSLMTTHHPVP